MWWMGATCLVCGGRVGWGLTRDACRGLFSFTMSVYNPLTGRYESATKMTNIQNGYLLFQNGRRLVFDYTVYRLNILSNQTFSPTTGQMSTAQ